VPFRRWSERVIIPEPSGVCRLVEVLPTGKRLHGPVLFRPKVRATKSEAMRVFRGIPRWVWQRGMGRSEATPKGGDGHRGELSPWLKNRFQESGRFRSETNGGCSFMIWGMKGRGNHTINPVDIRDCIGAHNQNGLGNSRP
jgi:hypothetical protein